LQTGLKGEVKPPQLQPQTECIFLIIMNSCQ